MNTLILIVIVVVIFVVFYYYNKKMITQGAKKVYIVMDREKKASKRELNKLKLVESDDRMIRLINSSDTNMTELGMAIDKSHVNIHALDIRHPGYERKLIDKFKDMTTVLVNDTKAIDPSDLYDDSDEDKDVLRQYINHWRYYTIIYDRIFIYECTEFTNNKEYDECYKHYREYYKNGPLEELRRSYTDISGWFNDALDDVSKRELMLNKIKDRLTDIFD